MKQLVFVLLLGACAAFGAESASAPPELAAAHAAWKTAESAGAELQKALSSPNLYVKLMDQQAELFEKADAAFREALRAAPDHPDVLADYGFFNLSRKQLPRALEYFGAALKAAREQPGVNLSVEKKTRLHRALGGLLERAGENVRALRQYSEAFRAAPDDPRNRLSLAIAHCAAGQAHEALRLLKPWADENAASSDGPLALYTLALAEEESGFPEDALAHYRKALECAQKGGATQTLVADRAGLAIARMEDAFDAMAERAKAREAENEARKKKNQEPLPDERASASRAAQLCDQGIKFKEQALEDSAFRVALARARENATVSGGETVVGQANFDVFLAGMKCFSEAILHSPRMPRAYFELASCNVMLGRFGEARKLLAEASALSPNSLAILQLYGEVLLQLGQWDESAGVFTRVLAIEPESGRANLGLARAYAGLQSDLRQCQAGLDALDRAEQLGVLIPDEKPSSADTPDSETPRSLRKILTEAAQRFERGEQPTPRPVVRGSGKSQKAAPRTPNVWSGTIFDR